jgi:DNA-binding CsgD family transcriptional regulator
MGSAKSWSEQTYGPERARSLRSRLFVLLRDELGLGRQPKVARLLVDEIIGVVEATLVDASLIRPGQALVLAPEVGQGPSWKWSRLEDKRMKTVVLDLVDADDIERLASGERLNRVRKLRLARLAEQAYEQGATLTSCQLAMLTGVSPSTVSSQLGKLMKETGKLLPMRGIVEDCSPAVTHKEMIVRLHLQGQSTSEIARSTNHTARSVERYIRRFDQVREFVRYLDKAPEAPVVARILGCSERLVRTYLALIPPEEMPGRDESRTTSDAA